MFEPSKEMATKQDLLAGSLQRQAALAEFSGSDAKTAETSQLQHQGLLQNFYRQTGQGSKKRILDFTSTTPKIKWARNQTSCSYVSV